MTEEQLRALVREAIDRHIDWGSAARPGPVASPRHASHAMFVLSVGADDDGACVIEPAVACTHCGYCKSYGH